MDGCDLLTDENLILLYFLLDGIKEQVVSLLLVRLNGTDVSLENVDILRLVDLDEVLLALVDEEKNSALGLITPPDLRGIWQVEWLLSLVQIEEMNDVDLSKLLDHTPDIVLWYCKLVQCHNLGS